MSLSSRKQISISARCEVVGMPVILKGVRVSAPGEAPEMTKTSCTNQLVSVGLFKSARRSRKYPWMLAPQIQIMAENK